MKSAVRMYCFISVRFRCIYNMCWYLKCTNITYAYQKIRRLFLQWLRLSFGKAVTFGWSEMNSPRLVDPGSPFWLFLSLKLKVLCQHTRHGLLFFFISSIPLVVPAHSFGHLPVVGLTFGSKHCLTKLLTYLYQW